MSKPSADPEGMHPVGKSRSHGPIYRWIEGMRSWRDGLTKHPVKNLGLVVAGFVLAWAAGESLTALKEKAFGGDDTIAKIREEQKAAFADLKKNIADVRSNLPSDQREAMDRVSKSVDALQGLQKDLTNQLSLATKESRKLSKALEAAGKPPGGYDFILSEQGGFAVSRSTVFGIESASPSGVRASLSTAGGEDVKGEFLHSGMSLPFRGDNNQACKVVLVSAEQDAASFKVVCASSGAPRAAQAT